MNCVFHAIMEHFNVVPLWYSNGGELVNVLRYLMWFFTVTALEVMIKSCAETLAFDKDLCYHLLISTGMLLFGLLAEIFDTNWHWGEHPLPDPLWPLSRHVSHKLVLVWAPFA